MNFSLILLHFKSLSWCLMSSLPILTILEAANFSPTAIAKLKAYFSVHYHLLPSTEALFVRLSHYIDSNILDEAVNLRWIVSPTTGLDHIDTEYLKQRGIRLVSLRDCRDDIIAIKSTGEFTLLAILALIRNIPSIQKNILGDKKLCRDQYIGRELQHMSVGIIGVGRIGSMLFDFLSPLSKRISFYDTDLSAYNRLPILGRQNSLEDLLSSSDIICICASYTRGQPPILGHHEFSLIKPSAFLVNTARAELVEKISLIENIRNGKLSGFAADVFWDESRSLAYDSDLIDLYKSHYNIFLTPHVAGCTHDAMRNTEAIIVDKFLHLYSS